MADQVQWRRGTTAQTQLFIGAQGEVTVDTDKNTLVVHDNFTPGGFPLATEEQVADGTFYFNDDISGGSAPNAYILVPKPNTNTPNSYQDGILLGFVTSNANTGPATANFQGLGVKNIKYPGGVDPAPGDVSGRVTLIYDSVNDWLELQRKPAGNPPQLRTIGGSVSGNALTVTLDPCNIDFRSPTLGSGAVLTRVVTSQISLVVPAGATLGTTNGVQSRIVVVAIDNAGTVELAVVNLVGAGTLDETGLISTTAISAAANSASTFYSTNARSGVAYRVVGYVQSTQAAAGTWSTTPSQVQGQGGQNIIGQTRLTSATAQNTTSGTSIDFTNIPANVQRITMILSGVSTNGTAQAQIQLGTSGGVVTTGYSGTTDAQASSGGSTQSITSGLGLERSGVTSAASLRSGIAVFTKVTGNQWVGVWNGGVAGTGLISFGNTTITLGATLDRIRLTTVGGTDAFDAGVVNIMYEA